MLYLCGRNFRAGISRGNVVGGVDDGGAERGWSVVTGFLSRSVTIMTIRHRLWIASAWAGQTDQRCVSSLSPYTDSLSVLVATTLTTMTTHPVRVDGVASSRRAVRAVLSRRPARSTSPPSVRAT